MHISPVGSPQSSPVPAQGPHQLNEVDPQSHVHGTDPGGQAGQAVGASQEAAKVQISAEAQQLFDSSTGGK